MGQTIVNITVASMAKNCLKALLENTEKYLLKKRFKLGNGECKFSQKDNAILHDIIETNKCEIFDDINKIIKEGRSCSHTVCLGDNSKPYVPTTDTLYQLWLSRGNSGSMSDFLDILLENESVQ